VRLEDIRTNAAIRGVLPDALVSVVSVQWYGSEALELTYKTAPARWPTSFSTATTNHVWR
jgi:hypothetical protein